MKSDGRPFAVKWTKFVSHKVNSFIISYDIWAFTGQTIKWENSKFLRCNNVCAITLLIISMNVSLMIVSTVNII